MYYLSSRWLRWAKLKKKMFLGQMGTSSTERGCGSHGLPLIYHDTLHIFFVLYHLHLFPNFTPVTSETPLPRFSGESNRPSRASSPCSQLN